MVSMKTLVAVVVTLVLTTACDVATPGGAGSAPTAATRPSASVAAAVSPSAAPTSAAPTTATAAPATQAPTAPPPPPPTAKPALTLTAVPPRAARGSTFVIQFKGFPTSANGLDVVQTVTLPNGAKLAPKTFTAKPDGTGFTTYLASLGDPSGQHVINLAGGGLTAFVIVIVD